MAQSPANVFAGTVAIGSRSWPNRLGRQSLAVGHSASRIIPEMVKHEQYDWVEIMTLADLVPEFLSDEKARLKKRAEIKAALQAIEAHAHESQAMVQQRKRYADQQDEMVDEHTQKLAPIVDRLGEIREHTKQLMIAGDLIPQELTDEQANLIHQRNALNIILEERIGSLRELIEQVDANRSRLNRETEDATKLRGQLASRGVANPESLLELYCAKAAVRISHQWRNAVSEQLAKMQDSLRETEQRREVREPKFGGSWPADLQRSEDSLRWDIATLQAELGAAEAQLEDATNEVARIREEILAE